VHLELCFKIAAGPGQINFHFYAEISYIDICTSYSVVVGSRLVIRPNTLYYFKDGRYNHSVQPKQNFEPGIKIHYIDQQRHIIKQ